MRKRLSSLLFLILCCHAIFAVDLDIKIQGVDKSLTKMLMEELSIANARVESNLSTERVNKLYRASEDELTRGLQALGFYDTQINKSINYETDKIFVIFDIELNTPISISSVNIDVSNNKSFFKEYITEVKQNLSGQYTDEKYEKAKLNLLNFARDNGFLDAKYIENEVLINKNQHSATIILNLKADTQYTFGNISIENSEYEYKFLLKFFNRLKNKHFSRKELSLVKEDLFSIDLFSKIRIEQEKDEKNQRINLIAKLTTKPQNKYSGSIGYGTSSKLRTSIGWNHNIHQTNGHKLKSALTYSSLKQSLTFDYNILGKTPAHDNYNLSSGGFIEQDSGKKSTKVQVLASSTQKFNRLQLNYGINVFREIFSLQERENSINKTFTMPNINISYINSVPFKDTVTGYKIEYSSQVAKRGLGSSANMFQNKLYFEGISQLYENYRFIARIKLGSINSKNFDEIPLSLRFFAGGDNSIRGYSYNSLGPRKVINGELIYIGAKLLSTFNFELERILFDKFALAVFYDCGNALNSFSDKFAQSTGIGARYRLPVGSLKIDIAKPIALKPKKEYRIHLSFYADLV